MTDSSRSEDRPFADGEWTYLTFDLDETCAMCHESLHAGQAVGYVDDRLVHARCAESRAA